MKAPRTIARLIAVSLLAVSALTLVGCGESEAALQRRHAEAIALIEARAMAEAKARMVVEAEAARARAEAERLRAEAYARSEQGRRRQAVDAVQVAFRPSFGIDNTWVLSMRNPSGITADFKLRCFDRQNKYMTFAVAMTAGEGQEIGFLEGWPGNFVSGEYCQAIHDGQTVWTVTKR